MPAVLHDDDRTTLNGVVGHRQDAPQAFDDKAAFGVVQPKEDNTWAGLLSGRQDFPKIQIEGQDNPILTIGLFKDLSVWQPL